MNYMISINSAGATLVASLIAGSIPPKDWGMWVEVGQGNPDTNTVISPTESSLYRPVASRPVDWIGYLNEAMLDWNHILYSETPTDKLHTTTRFPSYQSPDDYIREMAVYIQGSCTEHTGTLLAVINHSRIWWGSEAHLQREYIYTL